jgi:hypothetical protein
VTIRPPLFRQTKSIARSPCCSMTTSNSLQRPVHASPPSSTSIASRRTVPGRALARDRATIRWAADGGFGDRVGCIPPVRPKSQGSPGCLTAKETTSRQRAKSPMLLEFASRACPQAFGIRNPLENGFRTELWRSLGFPLVFSSLSGRCFFLLKPFCCFNLSLA